MLTSGSLVALRNVVRLKLDDNEIERIVDGAFEQTPALQNLHLSYNNLTEVDNNSTRLILFVCCVTFAESEPYCHSILSVCLSVWMSVGHSATYSLPRLIDHNQIWTRVSLFGYPIFHTFGLPEEKICAYSCHCERDASFHMTCLLISRVAMQLIERSGCWNRLVAYPFRLSVCLLVGLSDWLVNCGKTADWISMPFRW